MLKVSLKNFHPFQSYPFFKNTAFSKMALKIYQKLKNLIFFCIHGYHFYMGFQWYIACFDTFNIPWEIEAFTTVKFHSSPTVPSRVLVLHTYIFSMYIHIISFVLSTIVPYNPSENPKNRQKNCHFMKCGFS